VAGTLPAPSTVHSMKWGGSTGLPSALGVSA
jgi:hypothetical protein